MRADLLTGSGRCSPSVPPQIHQARSLGFRRTRWDTLQHEVHEGVTVIHAKGPVEPSLEADGGGWLKIGRASCRESAERSSAAVARRRSATAARHRRTRL